MSVDSIQTGAVVNAPQFKGTEVTMPQPEAKKQEVKKNGNALLYGSLAGIGVLALGGALYAMKKGKKPTFANFKKMGFKFEEGKILDKKGNPYTGIISGKANGADKVVEYSNGQKLKVTIKPKDGEYSEIVRTFEYPEAGKINVKTEKTLKNDPEISEISEITRTLKS